MLLHLVLHSSWFVGLLSILCQTLIIDLTEKIIMHVTKNYIIGFVFEHSFWVILFLVTCINMLLVKSKVKIYHKMRRGPINQDRGSTQVSQTVVLYMWLKIIALKTSLQYEFNDIIIATNNSYLVGPFSSKLILGIRAHLIHCNGGVEIEKWLGQLQRTTPNGPATSVWGVSVHKSQPSVWEQMDKRPFFVCFRPIRR